MHYKGWQELYSTNPEWVVGPNVVTEHLIKIYLCGWRFLARTDYFNGAL